MLKPSNQILGYPSLSTNPITVGSNENLRGGLCSNIARNPSFNKVKWRKPLRHKRNRYVVVVVVVVVVVIAAAAAAVVAVVAVVEVVAVGAIAVAVAVAVAVVVAAVP